MVDLTLHVVRSFHLHHFSLQIDSIGVQGIIIILALPIVWLLGVSSVNSVNSVNIHQSICSHWVQKITQQLPSIQSSEWGASTTTLNGVVLWRVMWHNVHQGSHIWHRASLHINSFGYRSTRWSSVIVPVQRTSPSSSSLCSSSPSPPPRNKTSQNTYPSECKLKGRST